MAVIREYYDGNTKITVCDDFCVKTDEEANEILKKIGDIYANSFLRKAEEKKKRSDSAVQ